MQSVRAVVEMDKENHVEGLFGHGKTPPTQ